MTERVRRFGVCLAAGFLAAGFVAAAGPDATAKKSTAPPTGPDLVGKPSVPTITPAVRDLPDYAPNPNLFGLEMKPRDDFGFLPIPYAIPPRVDPLLEKETAVGTTSVDSGFATLIHDYAGQSSGASPPDTVGDVGPNYFLQATNQSVSTVRIIDKATGADVKTFTMQSLATTSPCNHGYCDPVVLYDRAADRWLISELPSSGGDVCVYVSTTGDPTGTWYSYAFAIESSLPDYPKYGVWPQGTNAGSYLIGVNAGSGGMHDLVALDRSKMLAGQPASFQKFSVPNLPNSGFQLVLPSTLEGTTPPPDGEQPLFIRPHDDEAQNGASTPGYDWLDMWSLSVDWATPSNSKLTPLPQLQIGDYDMTLCGLGGIWNCMPQPNTSQKIDPIREPLHFPLQYRNFGDHQSLVGTFVEDVDGTDHAGLRWFELRKTGTGGWFLEQEGLVGGETGVHRSVGSIAMDGSGNIALGYTRTGGSSPYFPSIYYTGRLAGDTSGTMPQGEYRIVDATSSKTNNERWGDYSAMSVDPADDCTFWYTTEYGGSGTTKVAAFKFDQCGCVTVPTPPNASASAPQDERIDVSWDDSALDTIADYLIFRATTAGGPYTQIATVPDSSPGVASGPGYVYHDDTVSGGTEYYYVVRSTDGDRCTSASSAEVSALATGPCRLAPTFTGLASASNPAVPTCSVDLAWVAATTQCGAPVVYNVYRSTDPAFTPSASSRIASGVQGTAFSDQTDLAYGTNYFYVVRAVDVPSGSEDGNTVRANVVPTGAYTTSGWTDTFEGSQSGGGFDQPGWSHYPITGTTDWVWSTAKKHDRRHSWYALEVTTASDKVLVSPPFLVDPTTTLSFYHSYEFQGTVGNCTDGGTLEYSADGGLTWTVVPDADFTGGGYTGTVAAGSGNPIAGRRAWCAGGGGKLTIVTLNLGGDAAILGKAIQVRWHEGDAAGAAGPAGAGWYVDTVSIANAGIASACTTGTGSLTVGNDGPVCEGSTLQLTASWSNGGVTYSWVGPNGFASTQQNPAIPAAPAAAGGTYYVSVLSGADTIAAGSTTAVVNPLPGSAGGLGFADPSTLQWSVASSADGYDLVRGTLSTLRSGGFTPAVDACDANDLAATSFTETHVPVAGDGDWYLVRAENACGGGTYDDGSASQTAPRDAAIGASGNACP